MQMCHLRPRLLCACAAPAELLPEQAKDFLALLPHSVVTLQFRRAQLRLISHKVASLVLDDTDMVIDFASPTLSLPEAMRPAITHRCTFKVAIRFKSRDILPAQALKQMQQRRGGIPASKKHVFWPASSPLSFP